MSRKIKVLIADAQEENNALLDEIKGIVDVEVVGIYKDYEDTIRGIVNECPDVVILDLLLGDRDGFAVLEYVNNKLNTRNKPKIIVTTSLSQRSFVMRAMDLGADYYMAKPVNCEDIVSRIKTLINHNLVLKSENIYENHPHKRVLDEKISTLFITVGIPANIKGYQFLRDAIKLAIEEPTVINSITKKLYPTIAEKYETTPSKVERAIRHAIEVAWNRGKIENINAIFGIKIYNSNDKPTNGEFIALIADKMLIDGIA